MQETLEVDFKKIPEWLYERRKVEEDWNRKLKALKLKQHELVDQTLKTLKDKSITDYIRTKKADFNYLDCVHVIQQLDDSEEGLRKTFFGGPSSQIIRDWKSFDKLFKKGNLHIIELAKLMVQNVQYDIPGLRKQMVNLEQQINSTSQKVTEYTVQIKQIRADFTKQCQKYGIQGENISKEVPAMISQLPQLFESISAKVMQNKVLQDCLTYYLKYSRYACDSADVNQLSVLTKLHQMGDVPIQVLESNVLDDEDILRSRYEWYLVQKLTPPVDIKEWEVIEPSQSEEIDWSKYIHVEQAAVHQEPKFVDTLLANTSYRNRLITDLNEVCLIYSAKLLYFMKSRIQSTKQYSENALLQVYDGLESQGLFDLTVETYQQWHDLLESLLCQLNSSQFKQLLSMKDSNKSQVRIIDHLQEFKQSELRADVNVRNCHTKMVDLERDRQSTQQQLEQAIGVTREAKSQAQTFLRELIKWQVDITGEVNKLK